MADDKDCTGFRKVLMDFYVLSKCDILLVTGSGFGRLASYLRLDQSELYCFSNTHVNKCEHYNIHYERVKNYVGTVI